MWVRVCWSHRAPLFLMSITFNAFSTLRLWTQSSSSRDLQIFPRRLCKIRILVSSSSAMVQVLSISVQYIQHLTITSVYECKLRSSPLQRHDELDWLKPHADIRRRICVNRLTGTQLLQQTEARPVDGWRKGRLQYRFVVILRSSQNDWRGFKRFWKVCVASLYHAESA